MSIAIDAESKLKLIVTGDDSLGITMCLACNGYSRQADPLSRPPEERALQAQPKGLSFQICGCPHCGHIMRRTESGRRNLTKQEATELAASEDFDRIRSVAEEAISHLIG